MKKAILKLYIKLQEFVIHTGHELIDQQAHENLNRNIDQMLREVHSAKIEQTHVEQALSEGTLYPETTETEEYQKDFDSQLAQDL